LVYHVLVGFVTRKVSSRPLDDLQQVSDRATREKGLCCLAVSASGCRICQLHDDSNARGQKLPESGVHWPHFLCKRDPHLFLRWRLTVFVFAHVDHLRVILERLTTAVELRLNPQEDVNFTLFCACSRTQWEHIC
jgi:hypothetical protein